jgi:hypothetical protein
MQPLHILVPSSRSLEIVGELDHMALRSCIALLLGWMGLCWNCCWIVDMVELTWRLGVDVATVVTSRQYR